MRLTFSEQLQKRSSNNSSIQHRMVLGFDELKLIASLCRDKGGLPYGLAGRAGTAVRRTELRPQKTRKNERKKRR